MTSDFLLFFFLAAFAVTTAVLMVIQRNPVMSAIYLIANFFAIATLYLMLQAQLLAILQILVYAGAIMVLVVFVIMLLNLQDEKALSERVNIRMVVGVMLVFAFLLEMGYLFVGMDLEGANPAVRPGAEAMGTVEGMGAAMFGRFLLPFEVTSLLLLAAILGAVILAKKRIDNVQN